MVDELGRRTPALAFLLATVIAFAIIIVGALVILRDGLPTQALAVMGGAGAMALVWGIMLMAAERKEVRSQSAAPVLAEAPVSVLLEATSLEDAAGNASALRTDHRVGDERHWSLPARADRRR